MFLKAAVLEGHGRRTPLLLSKELLRTLGAVLDMCLDEVCFRAKGARVKMVEGH